MAIVPAAQPVLEQGSVGQMLLVVHACVQARLPQQQLLPETVQQGWLAARSPFVLVAGCTAVHFWLYGSQFQGYGYSFQPVSACTVNEETAAQTPPGIAVSWRGYDLVVIWLAWVAALSLAIGKVGGCLRRGSSSGEVLSSSTAT